MVALPTKPVFKECKVSLLALKDSLDVLSGKWKPVILIYLASFGTTRFKQLERDLKGISAKVLSEELKELEVNLLVSRQVCDTRPVTVEYSLTEYGSTVEPILTALGAW